MRLLAKREVLLVALALAVIVVPRVGRESAVVEMRPGQACDTNLLVNPSFDEPAVGTGWAAVSEAAMPGWSAEPGTRIETWSSGFLGFSAHSGANLVELNYVGITLIYQDVATTPGTELAWSSHHRSRSAGDAAEVVMGTPNGQLVQVASAETPVDSWFAVSGTYVVPDGQTVTRFGLRGLTGGGSGNLADDAYVAVSCTPEPPVVDVADDSFVLSEHPDGQLDIAKNDQMLVTFDYAPTASVGPTSGLVTISPDGYATYVPNPGATGTDTFSYELCGSDERGDLCDVATVSIDLDS